MDEKRRALLVAIVGAGIPLGFFLSDYSAMSKFTTAFLAYVLVFPYLTPGRKSRVIELLISAALLEIGAGALLNTPAYSGSIVSLVSFVSLVASGVLYYRSLLDTGRETGDRLFEVQGILYLGATAGWTTFAGPVLMLAWVFSVPVTNFFHYRRIRKLTAV